MAAVMLGDELAEALAELRAEAESRMRARCLITRPGRAVTDPDTGEVTVPRGPVYGTKDEPGRCYTRYPGLAFESSPEVAGAVLTVSRIVVRIPFGPIVRPDDEIEIVSDPDNPQMVGTRLRVASIDDQSQATAQRLLCQDFQSGR